MRIVEFILLLANGLFILTAMVIFISFVVRLLGKLQWLATIVSVLAGIMISVISGMMAVISRFMDHPPISLGWSIALFFMGIFYALSEYGHLVDVASEAAKESMQIPLNQQKKEKKS